MGLEVLAVQVDQDCQLFRDLQSDLCLQLPLVVQADLVSLMNQYCHLVLIARLAQLHHFDQVALRVQWVL